ncbi:LysR family transcriptional regulator [Pseudoprimorskyibacter insulae]|uniref:HTH-type transcriptional regulator CynR n=1 Tax=Pseudoprimorskyibacter insulae TaxID=1695997 RepID=A0A2R8AVL2_9RHOB|nr:LysR family transcriptional regulator [Pseudoprimorskyibacter insulae]SPF79909.1 HTH-type transcriptional regulator CynR [Pseudoprimorskyibacter insulae]
MALDTRQMRYFLEIAEQGSITRAAQVLNVAQPALSLHLKTLEERLGTQLLIRSRSGVTPTEAGQVLMRRARAILDDMARTEDEIRTLDADPAGVVRVGLPGTISALLTLPLIKAARARYPRITINIAEAMSGFIAGWMSEGQVDLAVLYNRSSAAGVMARPLLEEELVVLWPANAKRPEVMALSELRDEPMVLPSAPHGLRQQLERDLGALDIRPAIAMEVDSYANIKALVAAGYGASVLPRHAVQAEVAEGKLGISRLAAPGLWRQAVMVTPTNRPVTRAQQAVQDVLSQVVADMLANGDWSGARAVSP